MAPEKRPKNWVRLGCDQCDRDDCDGISETMLELMKGVWEDIAYVQSYEQAIKIYENPDDAPPGFSALDWWTHLGLCPDCKNHIEIADHDQQQILLQLPPRD